ncbi:tRNA 5-methoxyuridine(34)/uridine 5-oxyacetic acid(34) synthase CmoB [Marinicella sp. W31]|uniref:tRNA 5-methoxyuridine(34)/uridine 5-oxyacetic acid(34) synthase CmoB n=1 Tax=Marinicella sp. W31 TaxID=3023713 RepID=UPI00375765FF
MLESFYAAFWQRAAKTDVSQITSQLRALTQARLSDPRQGDLPKWLGAYQQLPDTQDVRVMLDDGVILRSDMSAEQSELLQQALRQMIPWRKGPFDFFNVLVDAEWRSDQKWQRLKPHLPELTDKTILDIGCGNGYYMLRMAAHDPRLICGIEPGVLQNIQFWSAEKYAETGAAVFPLKFEALPAGPPCFDVVFSMGVLYHRKSPLEHLEHIQKLLRKNGTLLLETLVVEGDETTCLIPQGRYAQMRNVWFLPSVPMLSLWLQRLGFKNVECVDVSYTTVEEQRSTDWMLFHSLPEFLDQKTGKTMEGHPPPMRAIIKACK